MQFDVFENPSPRMRDVYPYVVDVQSDLLSTKRHLTDGDRRQNSQDVLTVQVFVASQNVVNGHAAGQPLQNTFDWIAQATNTWLAMTDIGVDGDDGVHR